MGSKVKNWCKEELGKLMGSPLPDDIIDYILQIKEPDDIEEYMVDLFANHITIKHRSFIRELTAKLTSKNWEPNAQNPENQKLYKKEDALDQMQQNQFAGKPKKSNKANKDPVIQTKKEVPEIIDPNNQAAGKKKVKYVSLYSKEGLDRTVIQLPGRNMCECQAAKHKLINNCTTCGRVVCQQEGAGPCFFCGKLVLSKEDAKAVQAADPKTKKALLSSIHKGFEKAIEHKNKLLEFDKTSGKRTTVIDDQSDYFSVDSGKWLTAEQKKALKKHSDEIKEKKNASRSKRTVNVDLLGRQIAEEPQTFDNSANYDELLEVLGIVGENSRKQIVPDTIEINPIYEDTGLGLSLDHGNHNSNHQAEMWKNFRNQDKELREMSDQGQCLSMHQPYASLLVMGIKKHEGRTWYTPHRGRLWIASGVKEPSQDEIKTIETAYRHMLGKACPPFPKHYPVGCLLGCVDVVDCLADEEYRKQFPKGESESPYVFVCENHQELTVKFPIKGQHKIYQLDPKIQFAAKKTLKSNKIPQGIVIDK